MATQFPGKLSPDKEEQLSKRPQPLVKRGGVYNACLMTLTPHHLVNLRRQMKFIYGIMCHICGSAHSKFHHDVSPSQKLNPLWVATCKW